MDKIAEEIVRIIEANESIKAKDIAKLLGTDRKTINQYLYSDLRSYCYQTDDYTWKLRVKQNSQICDQEKQKSVLGESFCKTSVSKKPENNPSYLSAESENQKQIHTVSLEKMNNGKNYRDNLQRYCKYYIDCVLSDDLEAFEFYVKSKFSVNYTEVKSWPYSYKDYSSETSDMMQKLMTSTSTEGYFGYPVLLKKYKSDYKIVPLFMWDIDNSTGKINFDDAPTINAAFIKNYVSVKNEALFSEINRLRKELGIYDSGNNPSVKQMIKQLTEIRQWQWIDEMDPTELNRTEFGQMNKVGIYNKAVFCSINASTYTKGLVHELEKLSDIPIEECKGTALYNWINAETGNSNDKAAKFLQVVPLNSEQHKAIDKALTADIAVITGPPGTGKSQVVINLLINEVFNNRSVLFSSKNNKAVDVVIDRCNGLSNVPFIARLGGTAGNAELSKLLERVLSTSTQSTAADELMQKRNEYNISSAKIQSLNADLKENVRLRNQLEQTDRELLSNIDNIKDELLDSTIIDTSKLKNDIDVFVKARKNSFKENQSFFGRLRWESLKQQKENEAMESSDRLNSLFEKLEIKQPKNIDEIQEMNIDSIYAEMMNYINNMQRVLDYKQLRADYQRKPTLEQTEKKLIEETDRLNLLGEEFWKLWLTTNQIAIAAKDKRAIIEYLSAVQLLGDQQEENADIPDDVKRKLKKVRKAIPKYIQAQAITLLKAKQLPLEPGCFDLLVIDEASQCDIASALPLLYRAKRVAIIGDMKQLTHISSIPKTKDIEFLHKYGIDDYSWAYSSSSLYNLGVSRVNSDAVISLREHYRSHSDIIEFSNREFYSGNLIIATNYNNLRLPCRTHAGVRWIEIAGITERFRGKSARNRAEASAIVQELHKLHDNGYVGSIGIISPFKEQVSLIDAMVKEDSYLYTSLKEKNALEISTIHQFQGDEKDIIFFSVTVARGADEGQLYFLSENGNLFNVAVTRARSVLVAVGNTEFCQKCKVAYLNDFSRYVNKKMSEYEQENKNIQIPLSGEYPIVSNQEQVSDWEKLLYIKLFKKGILTIPQHPVDKYKLDLAIISDTHKLDIEVDGKMYHQTWNGELMYKDQLRNQRMFELGWDVIRFWVPEIRDNIDGCIEKIENWMKKNNVDHQLNESNAE